MVYLPSSAKSLSGRLRRQGRSICRSQQAVARARIVGLLLAALLWAALVTAQEPAGRFVNVQGPVEVLRGNQTLPATVGLALQPGDVMLTAANARAAILLSDGTQLKLAANSTVQLKQVSTQRPGKVTPVAAGPLRTVLQFFLGEGWLRSVGPADALQIEFPSATAATRGTEFALTVAPDGAAVLSVLDGLVRVANPQGAVLVAQGEQATAQVGQAPAKRVLVNPLDAVQWSLYYPGTVSPKDYPDLPPEERAELEAILAPYRAGRFEETTQRLAAARATHPTSAALAGLAALLALVQGQVPEAKAALRSALQQAPTDAAAHALLAEIALVQNSLGEAEAEAARALTAHRGAPSAWLAVSHVRQAQFRLEEALQAAEQALALDPGDVRAQVQAATLLFGMDRMEEAWTLTMRARTIAPTEATVLSLLGFLQLARGETEAALMSFRQASDTDSTLGQPHLGAGLALFRLGLVVSGLEELEAATLLDSQVSLYQSYLGKGLYQAGWRQEGLRALARAQALDPRDPTPHLYRGIFLTDLNRPAESIRELQAAVALNDNRGVYRSRLLLDRDLATKNVDLARAYRTLGQTERARLTAIKSIEEDPSNSAAHFLFNQLILAEGRTGAGTFRAVNRERLLTRLLLPVNQNSFNTFNDYTMLLEQPRLFGRASAQINAEPEGHLLALVLDGGTPRVAFRQELTQSEDLGFKPTNDDSLSYSTFTMVKVATGLSSSVLIDGGYNNFRSGDKSQDLTFFFAPNDPSAPNNPTFRQKNWLAFGELGYQIRLTPESQLLLRASTDWIKETATQFFTSGLSGAQIVHRDQMRNDFFDFEALYQLRAGSHRISLGVDYLFGHLSVDARDTFFAFTPPRSGFPNRAVTTRVPLSIRSGYLVHHATPAAHWRPPFHVCPRSRDRHRQGTQ